VQIRGIHGEHTETDDGIFDISNLRRLGRSEVDLVQDMYNGVKAMIEAEKELAGGIEQNASANISYNFVGGDYTIHDSDMTDDMREFAIQVTSRAVDSFHID